MTLDGTWSVHRTGGWLPPLIGVSKRIRGSHGSTALGSLPGVPFEVVGHALHYRPPLAGFVDYVEPETENRYTGRATFRGREFGHFVMERARPRGSQR